jgi:DNA polymerase-3 subunit delta'
MILGHKRQWQYLQKLSEEEKIPHALLFCGQENLGKKTLAIEFLKSVLSSSEQDIFCHPDFIFIEPSESEIQISQIRNLNWRLSLKSFSNKYKAAIIDKAHLMNQEAQNCFLKTLEEPKGDTIMILISEYPELLLPTIQSRIQKVKFYPVDAKEIEGYLEGKKLSAEKAKIFSGFCMGRPGLAIDFFLNPNKLENFENNIKEITEVINSDLANRFRYAKDLSQKDNVKEVLGIWLNYFRNILLSGINLQKSWAVLKKEYPPEKLRIILKNIQTTIFLISTTNVNQKLALELLLMDM